MGIQDFERRVAINRERFERLDLHPDLYEAITEMIALSVEAVFHEIGAQAAGGTGEESAGKELSQVRVMARGTVPASGPHRWLLERLEHEGVIKFIS